MFHDVERGRYRVEMELCADLVSLVALVAELNFAHKWCPFVKASEQVMDTEFLLSDSLVHRLVVHPVCRFLIGVIVLYVKLTQSKEDECWCVKFEDMHRTKPLSLRASYLSFDSFVLRFERDALQSKTCCSCEIRVLNVFAYVPAVMLFVVCREMFACFVREWTSSAQLLHTHSLDMFALSKQMQRKASHYIGISRHIGVL
jgi:xanthine/CO dehydrogenase XdhC/CoxF family maturation factor